MNQHNVICTKPDCCIDISPACEEQEGFQFHWPNNPVVVASLNPQDYEKFRRYMSDKPLHGIEPDQD